jgi:protein-tyrosine phosphatase
MACTVKLLLDTLASTPSVKPREKNEKVNAGFNSSNSLEDFTNAMAYMYEVMRPEVDEVFPNLFIGNLKGILSVDLLKKLSITHVLNLSGGTSHLGQPNVDPGLFGNIYYDEVVMNDFCSLEDGGVQFRKLKKCADMVKKFFCSREDAKVVVNCFAGLSRSSSTVLSYLILHQNMSAVDAIKAVKSKRDILPNSYNLANVAKIHNEKYRYEVENVFDVEKTASDFQREKFYAFLRPVYND